ncbi:DUF6176 family protein [Halosimplex amylolyticum]|uniref:DUF6176 family protein n=1 Tax=Halosimplex amylolyticum TaxID=3396616 RepID=UPI003F560B61
MPTTRLFKLPLDPDKIEQVRDHFAHLEQRRETFERGLALEKMNAEAAWLDENEPALYYLHEESDAHPPDIEKSDVEDEAILELSREHHGFFQQVAADGHEHPDDLTEFETLFAASARDRIE